MWWLIPAISIDCGFKLAVALILFVRYLETKEKVIFWWAMGWFFFGSHAAVELILIGTKYEPLWFLRHIVWAFTAVAFLESVGYMQRPTTKIWHIASAMVALGAIISSYIGVFVIRDWLSATVPTSFLNGLGFIGCAFYFLKFTKEKKSPARIPIFLGFFLNGVHNLDYPFLRPVAWFAPIGFSLGVVFSTIFAVGLIMMATEELQRQKEESQRVARELSILNAIATTVGQSLNLEEILKDVLDKVLEVMGVEAGVIYLLDEENKELNLKAHKGFLKESIPQIEKLKLDKETITGRMLLSGMPIASADILEAYSAKKAIISKEKLRGFVGIPLKSKNRVMGAMNIVSRSKRLFNPEDIHLLSQIGNTIGVAIENVKLHETFENWNKELEGIVVERTKDLTDARKAALNILEDINEAYRELKETQAQLVRKERLAAIGQMATVVSHELRNPLSNINTVVYYLKSKLGGKIAQCDESMIDIEGEIKRMNKIIADILEFSRPPKFVFNLSDINAVLQEALTQEQIAQDYKLRRIEVIERLSASIPQIPLDAFRFKQALSNIIKNALEAMPKGGRLIVETNVVDEEIEIKITDTGHGIPEENLEKIFEPFFSDKSKGIGLGLAIVRETVVKHRGRIWVESELGKGSSFVIRLPL